MNKKDTTEPKGMGGWLVLLTFSLIASCVFTIIASSITYVTAYQLAEDISTFVLFSIPSIIWTITYASILGYLFYLFVNLKENAVTAGKKLLLTILIISIISFIINILTPADLYPDLDMTELVVENFRLIIFSFVWLLYLAFSQRIKNTFPEKNSENKFFENILVVIFIIANVLISFLGIVDIVYYNNVDENYEQNNFDLVLESGEFSDGIIIIKSPNSYYLTSDYFEGAPIYYIHNTPSIQESNDYYQVFGFQENESTTIDEEYYNEMLETYISSVANEYDADFVQFKYEEGINEEDREFVFTSGTLEDDYYFYGNMGIYIMKNKNTNSFAAIARYSDEPISLQGSDKDKLFREFISSIKFVE